MLRPRARRARRRCALSVHRGAGVTRRENRPCRMRVGRVRPRPGRRKKGEHFAMNRFHLTLGATLGLALGAATAPAATITLTDCTAPPVKLIGKKTVVTVPGDDLVVRCALLPLNGQMRLDVTARPIFVDGANGGSIAAAGKGTAIALGTRG